MDFTKQNDQKSLANLKAKETLSSGSNACYVARCRSCEGSGTRPSALYLIPFWPTMLCRRCKGSGIVDVIPFHAATVYGQAVRVLRKAMIGDQNFRSFLQSDDAAEFRLALMDLEDALKESS